uniref:Neurotoxin-like protein NTL2 n=2 Tax=Naja TaxID=8638 RepID=3SO1_NAJAT|nr:RecName: Full=Neurotoxin-like protein NTL2; Flags: Precursor [Naja atra]APB88857.1 neurotoxin-like protein [Naja naja]CAB45156.1 neurotoxin-like protein [Naja atra]
MKTLLLSLVVVTIVCLDLGYTRLCLSDYSIFSETIEICPDGHNFCFKKFPKGITRLPWVIRGCAATCPKAEARVYVDCCARDKCNR